MILIEYRARENWGRDYETYFYLKQFLDCVKLYYDNGESIHLLLEPGDGARYEFYLLQEQRATVIAYAMVNGWCVKVGRPPSVVPGYIQEKVAHKVNECTLSVICDICNYICGEMNYEYLRSCK